MSRCEAGYLCDVCGRDVEEMTDSDLYLRYVLGEVLAEDLNISRERHIRCNPTLAQFIVDEKFEPVTCEGAFSKANLDADYVLQEEARVTRGWQRLQKLPTSGFPITEYPLPEVLEARQNRIKQESANETEYAERMRNYLAGIAAMKPGPGKSKAE
jgi:hypothetical protein